MQNNFGGLIMRLDNENDDLFWPSEKAFGIISEQVQGMDAFLERVALRGDEYARDYDEHLPVSLQYSWLNHHFKPYVIRNEGRVTKALVKKALSDLAKGYGF